MSWFGGHAASATAAVFKKPPVVAPAPTLLGQPLPPNAAMARSNATAEAVAAAKRQRAKAKGAPATPLVGGAATPPAQLQPRTLLGF